jgi:hypothetical protein
MGENMRAQHYVLGVLSFCIITLLSNAEEPFYVPSKATIEIVNSFETKNCFAHFIMIDNKIYLLKQKKAHKKQIAVVKDALAAYIAECLDIAHRIEIIPGKVNMPGKVKQFWPATLHTIAPGQTVRSQRDCKYNALRLRQLWAAAKDVDERGLTADIISYMTWHWQLPIIVALDLFIANSDRHCGNLCYDPETDLFCAIDMDDTFNKDLCLVACEKIQKMFDDESRIFTKEELKALQSMRNTLKLLVKTHVPKELIAKLHFFAIKAGFAPGNKIFTKGAKKKLLLYEEMITETYKSARKLIVLLDRIIVHKSRMLANVKGEVDVIK